MSHTYCVYILANRSRSLYTGMSNNLERRLIEHRQELIPGFTSRYRIFRLVHFELFGDVRNAIAREKEIKGWRREKKIRLIERHNSTWDLADHFPAKHKKADPSHHSPTPGERVRDDQQTPAPTLDPATRQPVIPNRPKSQFDAVPTPSPASHKANASEGPAVLSSSVIPNRPKSQFDPAPTPRPTSPKANAGEGSAVSCRSTRPGN